MVLPVGESLIFWKMQVFECPASMLNEPTGINLQERI